MFQLSSFYLVGLICDRVAEVTDYFMNGNETPQTYVQGKVENLTEVFIPI